MSTDIFETAADGTGTVRAAFDATAAECRPDIDALTRRALDRGQRVRRHRMVGKAVGSAAAAAAIGLGTVYALNDSGSSPRPTTIPGSGTGTHGENPAPDLPGLRTAPSNAEPSAPATTRPTAADTSTVSASVANAVATWRAHRGTLNLHRAAAWL